MEKRLVQPIHELIERKNERYVQLAHYNEERDQDQTSIIESDEDYVSWVRGHDSLKKRGGE
ncbi:hypothetical protein RYX53_15845, partial [Alkalibacillus haloalkaliphilus]|nr:hypothetical protein [Alkalibacillus haloalkaliphilus]